MPTGKSNLGTTIFLNIILVKKCKSIQSMSTSEALILL